MHRYNTEEEVTWLENVKQNSLHAHNLVAYKSKLTNSGRACKQCGALS